MWAFVLSPSPSVALSLSTLTMDNVRHLNDAHLLHLIFSRTKTSTLKVDSFFRVFFTKLDLLNATNSFLLSLSVALCSVHWILIGWYLLCTEHKVSKLNIFVSYEYDNFSDKVSNYSGWSIFRWLIRFWLLLEPSIEQKSSNSNNARQIVPVNINSDPVKCVCVWCV